MSANTKPAEAAGQEPYTREQHFALREAHCIAAGDAYFEVRPHLDAYGQRRSAFDDGFARGFDKGTELVEARAADRAAHESLAALASRPAARVALTWDQFVAACEAEYGEDFAPDEFVDVPEDQKEELMRVVRMVERAHGISEYALAARQQAQVPELLDMLRGLGFDNQCPESIGITLARWRDGYAQWLAATPQAAQAAQPEPEQAQQSERERFEDVARSLGFQRDELNRSNLSLVRKDYRNHATEECWKFWQAARADILARLEAVPLPEPGRSFARVMGEPYYSAGQVTMLLSDYRAAMLAAARGDTK